MIDLSKPLGEVLLSAPWTADAALDVATCLIQDSDMIALDWDREAGENWLSLIAEQSRIAMVSSTWPLLILAEGAETRLKLERSTVTVVPVPSFDADVLICDVEILVAAFDVTTSVLEQSGFSANDLWFATI
jgi:hypothetical protein